MSEDLVGRTVLGKLRVVRSLGEGGAGRVFEVEHLLTKHRRALKVIRDDLCSSGEAVARLVREAGVASRIDSPRVVETLDAGRLDDGRAYVLMELCEGRSLRDLLEDGPLSEQRAVNIARGICQALADVHRVGLVHRDIKPDNVMLNGDAVRLLDFGVCKLLSHDPAAHETLTRDGALAGTPSYMAPEQLDAAQEVDARSDIWATGVVLFEMLAGRRPFEGKTAAAIASQLHRSDAPGLPPELSVSAATREAVARALARDPAARFDSAREMLSALGGEPVAGDDVTLGSTIDERWRVVRELGRGGSATVFEVEDRDGGPPRALKLLLRTRARHSDALRRMLREAKLARELGKEHVVEVIASGFDRAREQHYLVMELCTGESLAEHIERVGPLASDAALAILAPLARTLDAVHARGVVHRDVKPANVFLSRDGDVRLLDFGIAKIDQGESEAHTATDVILGTPLYMAPEQAQTELEVGAAADRYALGQLAFTLLTGHAYFERDGKKGLLPLLGAIGRGADERASERAERFGATLPRGFDAWFRKAVALDSGDRFASAREQVDALAQALPATASGKWLAAWVLGLTAVAVVVVASVMIGRAEPTPAPISADTAATLVTPSAERGEATAAATSEAPRATSVALDPAPTSPALAASSATAPRVDRTARPAGSSRAVTTGSAQRPPDSLF